jgi:uncharacterized protein with PQ loop repeat
MTNHSSGLYHQQRRKRIHKKYEPYPHPQRVKRIYDHFIYGAVILAPIMNIPQVLKIWVEKDASGVSMLSWASFSVISVMWFFYGMLHKERPVMIMNFALVFMQLSIVLGVYLYG